MYRLLHITLLLFCSASFADSLLQGTKQVYLLDNQGNQTHIGSIDFLSENEVVSYKLQLHHQQFTDYFLSMKEMKCLEGPELWCHLGYPYQNPHTVTATDFRWLSHDLLFMFKKPSEFGANFWNGVYYEITLVDGSLVGTGKAVDLNMLAAPPESNETPPITDALLDELDSLQRWLPKLEIK
jgi:hypothetical protein